MAEVKQVKVDNWPVYFLQRLKHFFNRTDYCDLTLQFQDNAQLKVHRLVLSACTEYFELLERTCEMYEDCLVMPDDLQADVVVPIVNFMYTGQLEFKLDLLERLHQTSQIMNMPVLSKLLEAQRLQIHKYPPTHSYSSKLKNTPRQLQIRTSSTNAVINNKRTYNNVSGDKIYPNPKRFDKQGVNVNKSTPLILSTSMVSKYNRPKSYKDTSRPARYEVPEEIEVEDEIFDESFSKISYTSKPLVVHPETTKCYPSKQHTGLFSDTTIKSYVQRSADMDVVECKKMSKRDDIYHNNDPLTIENDTSLFSISNVIERDTQQSSNQMFDNILTSSDKPKVTIENKDANKNVDHAKIISEVLKKYPRLMKGNKNIKLKILSSTNSTVPHKKQPVLVKQEAENERNQVFMVDILDTKEAAKLISLGVENVKGPWLCLICGTPGKALNFPTYYSYRRHLIETHGERQVSTICEYCGLKSPRRNYLVYHMYTRHGVKPPMAYKFPKCHLCNYIALTEALLIRHKMSHTEKPNFRCNVCSKEFHTSHQLLKHIQLTGHKFGGKKSNLQCIYCFKAFSREGNLVTHLKALHKMDAKNDGIVDDSDEENQCQNNSAVECSVKNIKHEAVSKLEDEYNEEDSYSVQDDLENYQSFNIRQIDAPSPSKKILNTSYDSAMSKKSNTKTIQGIKSMSHQYHEENEPSDDENCDDIVLIGETEYIMRGNELVPKSYESIVRNSNNYIVPDGTSQYSPDTPSTSGQYTTLQSVNYGETYQPSKLVTQRKSSTITQDPNNVNQSIQIVVSNEEEYQALMSSNHSIIFDERDPSKTLTVLSTPNSATLDSTPIIDTQSSEMMIIPDEYQLNVPEAINTDNSNIVVVYSHQVEDNKPFHIITSQGMETQFVQSSSVITQNYETITTSSPVITTELIQSHEPWQNNISQTTTEDTANTMDIDEEISVAENDKVIPTSEHSLQDLPEVQISSSGSKTPLQGTNTQDTEEVSDFNINKLPVHNDSIIITEGSNAPVDINNHLKGKLVIPNPVTQIQSSVILVNESEVVNDNNFSNHATTTESQEPECGEIIEAAKDQITDLPQKPKQIDTLTLEWSDGDDTQAQGKVLEPEDKQEHTDVSKMEKSLDSDIENVEESTENIQREIEKGEYISEEMNLLQETNSTVNFEKDTVTSTLNKEASMEKISKLLNDWEENDSQEGNDSANKDILISASKKSLESSNTVVSEDQNSKKVSKIESLVNDWEEEEEEIKA